LKRCIALGKNDVVIPCAQKYHAVRGRGLHERQTQNLGIELLARMEVTNRNAEMNDASGLDHPVLPRGIVSG
jgi:hypothetical protein